MSGLRTHRPAALLGGVFRLGTSSTIDSLNPFIAFQSDAYTTFEYIYPTLVQYTPSCSRCW